MDGGVYCHIYECRLIIAGIDFIHWDFVFYVELELEG